MPIFDPRPDHVRSVVEKVALRQFLLRVLTSVSPVSVIPSSSSTRCCYQDKWEKRGNLPKNQSSLGSREALDRQVDSIQPEGTAIGQFDQYCQWFPSVLKKILSWYKIHVTLYGSHATLPRIKFKNFPKMQHRR